MAKQNLEKFLKQLAQDPRLMERYKANPKQVMTEHGVAAGHQDMIMKGDTAGIHKELGGGVSMPVTSIRNFKD